MKVLQDYDISVTLSMPRSPANVERGNFMVNLFLLDADASALQTRDARQITGPGVDFEDKAVMFNSRRTALLPYVDPVVSLASRLLFILYHIFRPRSETCNLIVPLAERVAFSKGTGVPSTAYVEIEAGQTIQIYSVSLTVTARLRGLRWLMFHYRLTTYVGLTLAFWLCECLFMGLAWATWVSTMGSLRAGVLEKKESRLKGGLTDDEEDGDDAEKHDSSDVSHVFPTYGRSPPLKHEPQVKEEMESLRALGDIPAAGAEADDEDDEGSEDGRLRDSGIGTSYSEDGSGSIRRRASRSKVGR
jgi:seipin